MSTRKGPRGGNFKAPTEDGPPRSARKRPAPDYGGDLVSSQQRTQSQSSIGYKRGALVKLQLKNFMTYQDVEIHFGPQLNMIIGPNGSGKSAILCALLVGLSGEAGVTGRASNVQDYIRLGADEAHIVIELYNPNGSNDVIHRTISRKRGERRNETESSWQLNGKKITREGIKQHVANMNLKVDNLCQFLPQERVVEFVKMSPKELLKNTEKAAGNQNMFQDHETLEELSAETKVLTNDLAKVEKELNIQQTLHDREKEDYERVQERQQIEEEITWLRLKKPWVVYEDKRVEYIKKKKQVKAKEKEFADLNVNDKPLKDQLEKCRAHIARAQIESSAASKKMKESTDRAKIIHKKLFERNQQIIDQKAEYERKLSAEEARLAQLKQQEEALKMTERMLKEIAKENMNQDLQPRIQQVERQIDDCTKRIRVINTNIDGYNDRITECARDIQMKKQYLNRKKQVFDKRLELLKTMNSNAYSAYDILRRHQEMFKDEDGNPTVYPPLMTLIDVLDPKDAKYVEMCVGKQDWMAFVCTTAETLQEFTRLVREKLNTRVNVILAPSQSPEDFVSSMTLNVLQRRGITARYAKDLFTAPDPVMAYLCQTYQLHEIPVVSQAGKDIEFLRNNFKRFYYEGQCFMNRRSRYDDETVTNNDIVPEAKILVHFKDSNEIEKLENEIRTLLEKHQKFTEESSDLKKEKQDLEAKIIELRREKNGLLSKKDKKRELEMKRDALNEKIQRLSKDGMDKDRELARLRRENSKLLDQIKELLQSMNDELRKANECFKERIIGSARLSRLRHEQAQLKQRIESEQKAVELQRRQLELFKNEVEAMRKEALELHQRATKKAYERFGVDKWDEIPEKEREKLDSLPDSVQDIDDLIVAQSMKLDQIRSRNIDIDAFNRRGREIRSKKAYLEEKRAQLMSKKEEMERVRNRWQDPLTELIAQINTNFSSLMARLGYAGQVELYIPSDDVNDFEKYGILIKVKFRDAEPLKELKPSHQSGGERSVATMIYMIALQELTTVPFRCVDEINQGMDETNERRVFDLIVETARRNSSQYLLFSPKLLSGLTYIDTMRICIVFNSPNLKYKWKEPEALVT